MVDEGEPDEFEPLFDYSRVQPNFFSLDDDDSSDGFPTLKRMKRYAPKEEKGEGKGKEKKVTEVIDLDDDDEDWLLPPPVIDNDVQKIVSEDDTIKKLRSMKQELAASFSESAEDVFRGVEESTKRDFGGCSKASPEPVDNQLTKPSSDRSKIVLSIQDKQGLQQFRVYADDKFKRLFNMYAEKYKLDAQHLVFCFDGDKISPESAPGDLEMEDDDIIEVHRK